MASIDDLIAQMGKTARRGGAYAKPRAGADVGGLVGRRRSPAASAGPMAAAAVGRMLGRTGSRPEAAIRPQAGQYEKSPWFTNKVLPAGQYEKSPQAGTYGRPASGMLSLGRRAVAQSQNSPQLQHVDGALIKYGRDIDTPWEAQTILNSQERDQLARYLDGVAGNNRPDDVIRRLLQQSATQQRPGG